MIEDIRKRVDDIRFRAYIKSEDKMVDVSSISRSKLDYPEVKDFLFSISYRKNKQAYVLTKGSDVTVMEYIGIEDSYDVPIYQNDIIEITTKEGIKHQVVKGETVSSLLGEEGLKSRGCIKVIGNVCQHTNLLEEHSIESGMTSLEGLDYQAIDKKTGKVREVDYITFDYCGYPESEGRQLIQEVGFRVSEGYYDFEHAIKVELRKKKG